MNDVEDASAVWVEVFVVFVVEATEGPLPLIVKL